MTWDGTLDRTEFVDWLKSKKPRKKFATTCRSGKCPLAVFVAETKGPFASVHISGRALIIRYNEDDLSLVVGNAVQLPWCTELPAWAVDFINRIDLGLNGARAEREVSPKDVLAVLKEMDNANA